MAKLLLAHRASVWARNARGLSPLHAAAYGHTEVAKLLLGAGADVFEENDNGETAEQVARQLQRPNLAEHLKEFARNHRPARRGETDF